MPERDDTDMSVAYAEAVPPDEHTARVRAAKQGSAEKTRLEVHDAPEEYAVAPEEAPPAEVSHPAHVAVPALKVPKSEPTATKVKAEAAKPAEPAEPAEPAPPPPKEPTAARVAAEGAPPQPSSTDLAVRAQKERRRQRDARAERMARLLVPGAFVGVGFAAVIAVSMGVFDAPPPPAPKPGEKAPAKARPKPPAVIAAAPEEVAEIPAIRTMLSEGLTVAAEGLPQVVAVDPPDPPPQLAGRETCRYAFAIWEFSPNKAYKFMTTCSAMEGQTLVGAYEVEGSRILMSPLTADGARLVTVLEVEKPSSLTTDVTTFAGGTQVHLQVRQRANVMKSGLNGEVVRAAWAGRNDTRVAGQAPPPAHEEER